MIALESLGYAIMGNVNTVGTWAVIESALDAAFLPSV
jgi:hypothetical protein